MDKILACCHSLPAMGVHREGNRARMKAMTLLLRYSGMRLGDCVRLRKDRISSGNRLFLYTQKTGTPVHVVLPPKVIEALAAAPGGTKEHFFWSGNGDADRSITPRG